MSSGDLTHDRKNLHFISTRVERKGPLTLEMRLYDPQRQGTAKTVARHTMLAVNRRTQAHVNIVRSDGGCCQKETAEAKMCPGHSCL